MPITTRNGTAAHFANIRFVIAGQVIEKDGETNRDRIAIESKTEEGRRFAALAGRQLYGWTGTCLGGRPGIEIGNFGNLYLGN